MRWKQQQFLLPQQQHLLLQPPNRIEIISQESQQWLSFSFSTAKGYDVPMNKKLKAQYVGMKHLSLPSGMILSFTDDGYIVPGQEVTERQLITLKRFFDDVAPTTTDAPKVTTTEATTTEKVTTTEATTTEPTTTEEVTTTEEPTTTEEVTTTEEPTTTEEQEVTTTKAPRRKRTTTEAE
jgi:hypothetical protein